jgi:hypothetical protein
MAARVGGRDSPLALLLREGLLQCKIEFQNVDARLAEDPKAARRDVPFNESRNLFRRYATGFGHALHDQITTIAILTRYS